MATDDTLQRLVLAVEGLGNFVKLTTVYKDMERSQRKLTKAVKTLNKAFDSKGAIAKLDKQLKRTRTTVKGLSRDASIASKRFNTLASSAVKTTRSFNRFGLVASITFGSLISRGVAALTNAFRDSTSSAAEFLLKIGEVQTISQQAQQTTAEWTRQLRGLSDEFGSPILTVVEASYQTLSNQIAEGAESTRFLREAQRLSIITASTLDNAVLALSGTLNSYALSADHARNISNALFKTQELGRLRLDEIAKSLGNVTILGSQLGITYEEIFAALSTLTIQGVDARVGMTFLRAIMLKLIKPTVAMQKFFEELGATSGKTAIAMSDFGGFLQLIDERARASGDALADYGLLFGRLRAISGKTGLTFEKFNKTLEELKDSTDAANTAFDIISKNIGKKFSVELNKIINFFKIDLGTAFVKNILSVTAVFGGFLETLKLAARLTVAWAASVVALKIVAFTSQIKFLRTAVVLYSGGVGSARAATILWGRALIGVKATLKAIAPIILFDIGFQLAQMFLAMGDTIDAFAEKWTNKFVEESNNRIIVYRNEMDALLENTQGKINEVSSVYKKLVNDLISEFDRLAVLGQLQRQLDQSIFQRQIKLLLSRGKELDAANLGMKRFNELLLQSSAIQPDIGGFFNEDQIKEFKRIIVELDATSNILLSINANFIRLRNSRIRELKGVGGAATRKGTPASRFFLPFPEKTLEEQQRLRRGIGGGQDLRPLTTPRARKIQQDALERVNKLLERGKGLEERITVAIDKSNEKFKETSALILTIEGGLAGVAKNLENFTNAFRGHRNFFSDKKTIESIAVSRLDKAQKILSEDVSVETLSRLLTQLKFLKDDLTTASTNLITGEIFANKQSLQDIDVLISSTILALRELKELETLNTPITRLEVLLTSLKSAEQALAEIPEGFAKIAEQGIPALQGFEKQLAVSTEAYLRALASIRKALSFSGVPETPQPEGNAFGKFITRAHGGSIGKDSQNVLVDPREFIMNAKQSSKFLPQLIAMNSGSRRFETGGVVNNTVGDINVNVTTAEGEKINARTLGNALRRELRRNTIRLN